MNLTRVRAIVAKEVLEIRKNPLLLVTIFLPPILFLLLPLAILAAAGSTAGSVRIPPDQLARMRSISPALADISGIEFLQLLILQQFLTFFLMMPLLIPVSIAAYSIIGEKELKSLEPLLATPVRTAELLLGKGIAAVVPAILTTWVTYVLFLIGARLIVTSDVVYARLFDPMWLLAMILLAPLFALFAVNLGIIVSSRVNDVRVAQQMVGIIVLPVVLLGVGQTTGLVLLNSLTFIAGAFAMLLIDAAVLYIGARLFQRETILTQWK